MPLSKEEQDQVLRALDELHDLVLRVDNDDADGSFKDVREASAAVCALQEATMHNECVRTLLQKALADDGKFARLAESNGWQPRFERLCKSLHSVLHGNHL